MKASTLFTVLSLVLLFGAGINLSLASETVYGWQLMSEQERKEHRVKMRSFRTEQEREAYRLEHHKRMQERAREKGITLPDKPRPMGKGMYGKGGGGKGMGGGAGRDR